MPLITVTMYVVKDLARNRWSLLYVLFFLVVTEGLLRMVGDSSRVMLSLMNVVLLLVPLVGLIFGVIYYYGSREFVKLLLAQPIQRKTVFMGLFLGLSITLGIGLTIGVLAPFVIHGVPESAYSVSLLLLLGIGWCLTSAFVGFAFLAATLIHDSGKGVAAVICCWFLFAIVYDGAVLLVAHIFADYPLERFMIAASIANPIDLGRILLLLKLDISALMGYTGAVFERFFEGSSGMLVSACALIVWGMAPAYLALRRFTRLDL